MLANYFCVTRQWCDCLSICSLQRDIQIVSSELPELRLLAEKKSVGWKLCFLLRATPGICVVKVIYKAVGILNPLLWRWPVGPLFPWVEFFLLKLVCVLFSLFVLFLTFTFFSLRYIFPNSLHPLHFESCHDITDSASSLSSSFSSRSSGCSFPS